MSYVDQLLSKYRNASEPQREKGTYFERLAVAFLSAVSAGCNLPKGAFEISPVGSVLGSNIQKMRNS